MDTWNYLIGRPRHLGGLPIGATGAGRTEGQARRRVAAALRRSGITIAPELDYRVLGRAKTEERAAALAGA